MIVVVGLGNIGLAVAARLAECGEDVLGVDLSADRRREWHLASGRQAVAGLDAVECSAVDMVVVLVRLTGQAEAVLSQLDDLPLRDGTPVLLMTTLERSFAATLDRYADRRYRVVESPVSGGARGAAEGRLTVMAAGPLTDADERRLRDTVAAHVVRFAEYGEPSTAKLLNNVTAAYNARALADVLLLGDRLAIDARRLYDVIVTSSGGSWMASSFEVLVDELLDKDVALLRDELGELPTISLAAEADLVGRLAEARRLLAAPGGRT